jgi:HlyD family secretion protein
MTEKSGAPAFARPAGRASASQAAVAVCLAITAGCGRAQQPDAYGNVEATEVVVSAESAGRLTSYTVVDGQTLAVGAVVGAVDAAQLAFERDQVAAQRAATAARIDEVREQIAVVDAQRGASIAQRDALRAQRAALVAQHDIAKRAYDRTTRLIAEQAATSQQLDQAERDYRTLGDQIAAQDNQIGAQERQIAAQGRQMQAARAQEQTIKAQVVAADAQLNQVGERIRKTEIRNPIAGTVLTTYAKAGEVVQPGQPLYRIANLASVEVRAYVAEPQLARIRIGQPAVVTIDAGPGRRQSVEGLVSWISAQAEFTPTPIQTREERADLVYAVKIRVPNDAGALKIGMPADVQLVQAQASR